MNPSERARHIRTIIDQNADDLRAFPGGEHRVRLSNRGLGTPLAAVHRANQAQIQAINAIVAANDAALALSIAAAALAFQFLERPGPVLPQ